MKNNGVSKKPLKKYESLQSRLDQDLNGIRENRKLVKSFFHAEYYNLYILSREFAILLVATR